MLRRIGIIGGIIAAVFIYAPQSNGQTIELACPAGTTSVQSLQTVNQSNGKLRQNYCVDTNGNVFQNLTAGIKILKLNNIPFSDQAAGSDFGARISSVLASCPNDGCVIDARGESDPVTWSTQVTATKPFKLLLPQSVINLTGTLPAITVTVANAAGWSIEGINPGWQNGGVTSTVFTPSLGNHGTVININNTASGQNQNFTIQGVAFDYGIATGNVASTNSLDRAITFTQSGTNFAFRGHFYHLSCIFCYDVIYDATTNSNVMEFDDIFGQALGDGVLQFVGASNVHDQMHIKQSGCNGFKALNTISSTSACIRLSNSNNVTLDQTFAWHGNDTSAGTGGAPAGFFGIELDSGQSTLTAVDLESNFYTGSGSGGIFINGGQSSILNPTSRTNQFGNTVTASQIFQAQIYTSGGASVFITGPSFPKAGGSADVCAALTGGGSVVDAGIASTNASDSIFLFGASSINAPTGTNCSPANVFTLGGKIIGITNQTGFTSFGGSVMSLLTFPLTTGAGVTIPQVISTGTATMTTAAIAAGACGTTVTVASANVLATDSIIASFNAAPSGTNAGLTSWPTVGNVNFAYCPGVAETPVAATINWRVER